ncbi:hypothetical protein PFICI_15368 [Pestalotiopsis fici W106-1]|uniref:Molybdate-anion transporter n=1 Tax=Pestalotiopsis fici (strain W106-1 / CGMCC3.15140) TaxID=1229662 RepID=W3WJJ4_PESFW|nr:uncharacterized protein PFICI_15368 [Pestalotiopsis fici W106-1]ETS72976.1 hypothetical protein PFICI_15368 [Pestalotiopsis fici W106-1]
MRLNIYWNSLIILSLCVGLILGCKILPWLYKRGPVGKDATDERGKEAKQFLWGFLSVYLMVMGSEWLQGPYLWALLHDEKHLSSETVAILYATGYCAAAISAPFTGYLADKCGRRGACITFCVIHSASSFSVSFDRIEILAIGRVLGGVGITLLWTVFESWMISEHRRQNLEDSPIPLSSMFGIMTIANCITAMCAGLLSHCIVWALGSKTHPFMLGILLDTLAAVLMMRSWNENRGIQAKLDAEAGLGSREPSRSWRQEVADSLRDWKVLTLSLISCCFEGTIFLFRFYWPGTLQKAHNHSHGVGKDDDIIPHGVIFANLMATMVLGALLFGTILERSATLLNSGLSTFLLSAALFFAGASFLTAAYAQTEAQLFCSFLLLEACNGLYIPSMAFQRGQIVSDSGRASVYGLMNIPLFLFVILALLSTNGDGEEYQNVIFIVCAAPLMLAAVLSCVSFLDIPPRNGFSEVSSSEIAESECARNKDESDLQY